MRIRSLAFDYPEDDDFEDEDNWDEEDEEDMDF